MSEWREGLRKLWAWIMGSDDEDDWGSWEW